jgi:hypothetical protein
MHKPTKTCQHCLAERGVELMRKDEHGSYYCADITECLESYANLPWWLHV